MSDLDEEGRKPMLPRRLAREQEALGMILGLISRSLAIIVIAVAAYLLYVGWQ